MSDTILVTNNLTKKYGDKLAVDSASISIRKGAIFGLIGMNGAGKTTFALQYLPKIVSCNNFINADEIAKGVSPLNFEAGLLQASKIFLQSLDQKLESKETFAFETTLSGRSYLTQIPQWQQDGWKVVLKAEVELFEVFLNQSNGQIKVSICSNLL